MFALHRLSFFLIVCCLSLPVCTHAKESPMTTSPYSMTAEAYLSFAKNKTGEEQQSLMMLAAGRLIEDGSWRDSLIILSQMNNLSPKIDYERQLLLAQIDLMNDHPNQTISKLAKIEDLNLLSMISQIQFHELLAKAYHSLGNLSASLHERIVLDKLFLDESARQKNRQLLWRTIMTLPSAELDTLVLESRENTTLKGWLELAVISRHKEADTLLSDLLLWQTDHEGHEGQAIFSMALERQAQHLIPPIKKIALLLPLSGALAGPGEALRDGFMEAYEENQFATKKPTVQVYDTDKMDVRDLYQEAWSDGADLVIGPLSKNDVAKVALMEHPIPTFLLNDVDTPMKEGAYIFAVSPSHEARQVALKARKKGYSRALVIAPRGAWGEDVVLAFNMQWEKQGGIVADTLLYQPNDDMSKKVSDFLKVSDSFARNKKVKALLGPRVETVPSRRQDFDMIFLLAYPSKARQIMPLIKYYEARDIAVYSTSVAYSGRLNTMQDKDLDGIIFCDSPWVLAHQTSQKNWPEQFNSYNRLHALGRDSYDLINKFNQLLLFKTADIDDKNGVFYLNSSKKIARTASWATFDKGVVRLHS